VRCEGAAADRAPDGGRAGASPAARGDLRAGRRATARDDGGDPAGRHRRGVLVIDTVGAAATLVTIDRGSDDDVRIGDRGWLIDDDGRPVRGSEFVLSQVHDHRARGAIRFLSVEDIRRYPRAQLLPSN
jgi:hypothetical protein